MRACVCVPVHNAEHTHVHAGVVGLASLEAWDSDITHQAVSLYQEITQELLAAAGGYLVEAGEKVVVACTQPRVLSSTCVALMHLLSFV